MLTAHLLRLAAADDAEGLELALRLRGANVNFGDAGTGRTPLHAAAQAGAAAAAAELLNNGATVDPRDRRGCTPLFLALLERGLTAEKHRARADSCSMSAGHNTEDDPCSESPRRGEVARRRGAPPRSADADRSRARGLDGVIQLLLSHGADIGAMNAQNASVAHCAAALGGLPYLMHAGPAAFRKLAAREGWGLRTPLHYAVDLGRDEAIECLLEAVGARIGTGENTFAGAGKSRDTGTSPKNGCGEGEGPIDCFAGMEPGDALTERVQTRCEEDGRCGGRCGRGSRCPSRDALVFVNAIDAAGWTPLHWAARRARAAAAVALLRAGADCKARDFRGLTPGCVARIFHNPLLAELIEGAAAEAGNDGSGFTEVSPARRRPPVPRLFPATAVPPRLAALVMLGFREPRSGWPRPGGLGDGRRLPGEPDDERLVKVAPTGKTPAGTLLFAVAAAIFAVVNATELVTRLMHVAAVAAAAPGAFNDHSGKELLRPVLSLAIAVAAATIVPLGAALVCSQRRGGGGKARMSRALQLAAAPPLCLWPAGAVAAAGEAAGSSAAERHSPARKPAGRQTLASRPRALFVNIRSDTLAPRQFAGYFFDRKGGRRAGGSSRTESGGPGPPSDGRGPPKDLAHLGNDSPPAAASVRDAAAASGAGLGAAGGAFPRRFGKHGEAYWARAALERTGFLEAVYEWFVKTVEWRAEQAAAAAHAGPVALPSATGTRALLAAYDTTFSDRATGVADAIGKEAGDSVFDEWYATGDDSGATAASGAAAVTGADSGPPPNPEPAPHPSSSGGASALSLAWPGPEAALSTSSAGEDLRTTTGLPSPVLDRLDITTSFEAYTPSLTDTASCGSGEGGCSEWDDDSSSTAVGQGGFQEEPAATGGAAAPLKSDFWDPTLLDGDVEGGRCGGSNDCSAAAAAAAADAPLCCLPFFADFRTAADAGPAILTPRDLVSLDALFSSVREEEAQPPARQPAVSRATFDDSELVLVAQGTAAKNAPQSFGAELPIRVLVDLFPLPFLEASQRGGGSGGARRGSGSPPAEGAAQSLPSAPNASLPVGLFPQEGREKLGGKEVGVRGGEPPYSWGNSFSRGRSSSRGNSVEIGKKTKVCSYVAGPFSYSCPFPDPSPPCRGADALLAPAETFHQQVAVHAAALPARVPATFHQWAKEFTRLAELMDSDFSRFTGAWQPIFCAETADDWKNRAAEQRLGSTVGPPLTPVLENRARPWGKTAAECGGPPPPVLPCREQGVIQNGDAAAPGLPSARAEPGAFGTRDPAHGGPHACTAACRQKCWADSVTVFAKTYATAATINCALFAATPGAALVAGAAFGAAAVSAAFLAFAAVLRPLLRGEPRTGGDRKPTRGRGATCR